MKREKNYKNFDLREFNRRELLKCGLGALIPIVFGGPAVVRSLARSSGRHHLYNSVSTSSASLTTSPNGWIEPPKNVVPSACWQCVTRCALWFVVENGFLTRVQGNPNSLRTRGKICVKSHGAVTQVYNPDRILFPMKRASGSKRGDGNWQRISWDEALGMLAERINKNLAADTAEKIMFHYGRMKGSHETILKNYFMKALGSKTIGNHTAICEGGKWVAQELTWGKHYDVNDVERTNFILNFGCNVLETHTSHNVLAQRVTEALHRGVPMYTFDVRLSNTAAKSTEWIPIKPGTDLAVVLAMAHCVIEAGLYEEEFINKWTNVSIPQLSQHLADYTPEWAEGISGVSAEKIRSLALAYAKAKPATIISYRGAIAHFNGVQTERAILMLEALCGNIDVPGGRCKAVSASWKSTFPEPHYVEKQKKLNILDGEGIAYPNHNVSHQVLKMIKDGKNGRPDIYITYCYNPVYANGNIQENIEVLSDEELIPFHVAVTPYYSESAHLADLILPDATYPERWTLESHASYDQIAEYYIRQPAVKPLAEARDFADVACELAKMVGRPLGFMSHEEFVRDACENTPGVKEAGGFEFMKKYGVWYDKSAKPVYRSFEKTLSEEELAGTIVDEKTGVIWKGEPGQDYTSTPQAYEKYVGQMIEGVAYKGFPPDKINKSGKFEIFSKFLEDKGYSPIPAWTPIPEHQNLDGSKLILTTFKFITQTQSRTQNCKYLTEIYHDNPAWLNPDTAKKFGIKDGDRVKVSSEIGSFVTRARVTNAIIPGVVAVSHHCGHWQYGRYASGVKSPLSRDDDLDLKRIWWLGNQGVHPNWAIPNSPEPIGGQQRWMDTVVSIEKV